MLTKSCSYQIDATDKIIFVGGTWHAFAKANGGQSLLNAPPLNQPIWDFIIGISTQFIYHTLINSVRATHTPVTFPFRCDSPDTIRYLKMEISPGVDNSIWFRTIIKREISPNSLPANDPAHPQEISLIKMCSWCKLIFVRNNWLTLEDAIWFQGLLDGPEVAPITHGICPDCSQIMQEEIKAVKRALQQDLL